MNDLNKAIVCDVETSGIHTESAGLLSIGAVRLMNLNEKFYVECRLDDDRSISEEALKVNGFTPEQCRDEKKMTELQAVNLFYDWASQFRNGDTLIFAGHNPTFDAGFLRRKNKSWPFRTRFVDLHSVAFSKFLESFSHAGICAKLGLPEEPHPHNGLEGALSEAHCLRKLLQDAAFQS